MEPLLVTPAEAGLMLGVSRSKVYKLMATGQLASVHIGRSRRITTASLRAYIARLAGGHDQEQAA